MVSYIFGKGGQYEKKIDIPVKVMQEGGEYRIGYITPQYQELAYGDHLFYSGESYPRVDRSEPRAFIKSFYDLYTAKYSSMLPNFQQEMAALREEYLTPRARELFAKAAKFASLDGGSKSYDLLICGYDFINQDRSTLKVNPVEEKDTYYVESKSTPLIWLEVIEKDGKWYIDYIFN